MEVLIAPALMAVSCIIFDMYLSKVADELFGIHDDTGGKQ